MPVSMRVVGKQRLAEAIAAGDVPAVAARAWLAEAAEADWAGSDEILEAYENAEELDGSRILVPLDDAGHCVVIVTEYQSGVVLVAYAGRRGRYRMRVSRTGGRS